MSPVQVTVLVITYNHARFIETAIESVMAQETDFEFEVVISEDCSTDGTREVVQRLAAAHPDRIRTLLSDRNLNDNSVVRRGVEAAQGRYLALLDGDDFWTSKHKLQRQVDFLEGRPDCSACFHNVQVVYDDGTVPTHLFHQDSPSQRLTTPRPKPLLELADMAFTDPVSTCSVVLRTQLVKPLPAWFDEIWSGDWALLLLSAQHGPIAYLDEIMATWRIHAGGVWSQSASMLRDVADLDTVVRDYEVFNEHLDYEFDDVISQAIARYYGAGARALLRRGQYPAAQTCARRSLERTRGAQLLRRGRMALVLLLSTLLGLRARRA